MEITFKIVNQTVKRVGESKPANHSQEFLKLKFDFMTDDWDNLTKFALFKNIEGTAYRVALTDNSCIVPNAVLQEDRFLFSVYGVNNDDVRATTNQTLIYVHESGYTRDVENDIPDDDPSVVEQIYLDIATAKSEAESYAKDYADDGVALKVDKTTYEAKVEELETGKSDVGHTHTKSDITDFSHTHDDRYYTESEIDTKLNGKANTAHTHKEADITDLKEYALADHNHDSRYYTESEVDTIISNLRHDLLNRCNFTSDKQIIQTDEIADITSYLLTDGMPKANTTIYFYEKEDN